MIDAPTLDCEDCGTGIEFVSPDGKVQPDAEVSCPTCGAVHVVDFTDGDGEQPDVHLTLLKHGAKVIAEERALSERRRIALEADARRSRIGAALVDARAELDEWRRAYPLDRLALVGAPAAPWPPRMKDHPLYPMAADLARGACPVCGQDTTAEPDGRRYIKCGATTSYP